MTQVATQEQKKEFLEASQKLMSIQKPTFLNRAKKAYRILFNIEKKITPLAPAPKSQEELKKEAEDKQRKKYLSELKMAQVKVKEMYDLFMYLESQAGNRVQRKQFRRDFISNGAFGKQVLENALAFYAMREKLIESQLQPKPDTQPVAVKEVAKV